MDKQIFGWVGFIGLSILLSGVSVFAQNPQFSMNLKRGSGGPEVTRLQEFLKNPPFGGPDIYPEGIVTGYFGVLTEKAVKRFQAKYGIEQAGLVGPKTRAKLNSLKTFATSWPQIPQQQTQQQQQKSSSTQPPASTAPQQTGIQKQPPLISPADQFIAIEKELREVNTNLIWLSPSHYDRILRDISSLESKEYSRSEIERLRGIARALAPHIADQENAQKSSIAPSVPLASAPPPQTMTAAPPKPLLFKNLGVNFEPWDKNTNRAGAFLFLASENKLFLEYGAEVPSPDGIKILPTFEYRTAVDADVFAMIDGVITKVMFQADTQDYAIHIQPELNSQWVVEHDHVSNVKIFEGNTVKAGDVLGKAGTLGGQLGRTEIMFWTSIGRRPLTYCPFKYFDPDLRSIYEEKVARHMKDWEEFKGNTGLYAEEKHIFPGCAYEKLED